MTTRQADKQIALIKKIGLRNWATERGISTYEIAKGLSIDGVATVSRSNIQSYCGGICEISPMGLIAIHYALRRGEI